MGVLMTMIFIAVFVPIVWYIITSGCGQREGTCCCVHLPCVGVFAVFFSTIFFLLAIGTGFLSKILNIYLVFVSTGYDEFMLILAHVLFIKDVVLLIRECRTGFRKDSDGEITDQTADEHAAALITAKGGQDSVTFPTMDTVQEPAVDGTSYQPPQLQASDAYTYVQVQEQATYETAAAAESAQAEVV
eukprot:TRINITY_DN14289_c0_g1_i1.p1 TRINITY_DN14289_c0_g1~~TRINITY_DN14289_c0_g1_i1.p1  ORF type:complete len:201 (+),score=31.97 TRINITY_DN14289_c0_g1_i1:40-603(+)